MIKSVIRKSLIATVAVTFCFAAGCSNDGSLEGTSTTHWSWPFDSTETLERENPFVEEHWSWPFDQLSQNDK
jgi:hypothetical protein